MTSKKCSSISVLANSTSIENAVKIACQSEFAPEKVMILTCSQGSGSALALLGKHTASQLKCVEPESVEEAVQMSQCVLLGAEAVLESGSFINREGTFRAVRAAFTSSPRVPVYVVCRSDKVISENVITASGELCFETPEGKEGIRTVASASHRNGHVECIDGSYVSFFVTEKALIEPNKIYLQKGQLRSDIASLMSSNA